MKKQNEEGWVDVHNDALMVELGFRYPNVTPRDPSVWTKTPSERKALKRLRHSCKRDMHFNLPPIKFIPVKAKLIIYLKRNNKFPKTVYSIECYQHNIPSILAKYQINRNKEAVSVVSKYQYNGKTYKPNEVPYW